MFRYENYPHSFKDQWINWDIWNGELTVSFDFRQEEQVKLFGLIHARFKGIPQMKTLKVVNEKNFYLDNLERLIHIDYPKIVSSVLDKKTKHQSGHGGWTYVGEYFYTYDWKVTLSDNTVIDYHNQKDQMDLTENDHLFRKKIQERAFCKFLKEL